MNTIIWLDDEEVLVDLLGLWLEFALPDTRVKHAKCSGQAMEYGQVEPVCLLITDLDRPARDGFAFIGDFRLAHPEVAILVVSGYATCPTPLANMGLISYLAKPFSPAGLTQSVQALVPALAPQATPDFAAFSRHQAATAGVHAQASAS